MTALLYKILLGAVLGGSGCALVGFLMVNLRLPFLAVCLSHAALAGAVLGHLFGIAVLSAAGGRGDQGERREEGETSHRRER